MAQFLINGHSSSSYPKRPEAKKLGPVLAGRSCEKEAKAEWKTDIRNKSTSEYRFDFGNVLPSKNVCLGELERGRESERDALY